MRSQGKEHHWPNEVLLGIVAWLVSGTDVTVVWRCSHKHALWEESRLFFELPAAKLRSLRFPGLSRVRDFPIIVFRSALRILQHFSNILTYCMNCDVLKSRTFAKYPIHSQSKVKFVSVQSLEIDILLDICLASFKENKLLLARIANASILLYLPVVELPISGNPLQNIET